MNHSAILALLGDLYAQNLQLANQLEAARARIRELETQESKP